MEKIRRKNMKLGKCAAALVVTSFLLTGCGNSKTVKEDGKYVVDQAL